MHITIPSSHRTYTENVSSHESVSFSIKADFSVKITSCSIQGKESLIGETLSFDGVGDSINKSGITFELK